MTPTDADVLAFAKRVIELVESERNALKAAGLDVDLMLKTLTSLLEQAAAADAQQESAKRQSKASTESWLAVKKTTYVTSSGYLDMCIAAVHKDSDMAENFRRLRSRMHRPNQEEQPIVSPIATPVKG